MIDFSAICTNHRVSAIYVACIQVLPVELLLTTDDHTLSKRKVFPSKYFSFLVRIIASVLLEDNVFGKKPKHTILLINEMDKRKPLSYLNVLLDLLDGKAMKKLKQVVENIGGSRKSRNMSKYEYVRERDRQRGTRSKNVRCVCVCKNSRRINGLRYC